MTNSLDRPRTGSLYAIHRGNSLMENPDTGSELDVLIELLAEHSAVRYGMALTSLPRRDKYLLLGSGASFGLALILTVTASIRGTTSAGREIAVLGSLALAIIGAAAQALPLVRSLSGVLQPATSFLRDNAFRIANDYKVTQQLRGARESAVRYLGARLHLEADHIRGRVGIVIGAVDKVGLIPLIIGWLFSGTKFLQGTKSIYLNMTLAALGILYVLSVMMIGVSYRIDELAQLVESALEGEQMRAPE